MRAAVVDASVALAWVIPDEKASPAATALLLAFRANQIRLFAPSLWAYEAGNALRMGIVRGRISEEEGREAFMALLGLGLSLIDLPALAQRAWELASRHGITIYDAAYVALAQAQACPFYTSDKGLIHACAELGFVRPIDDFTP